MPDSDEKDDEWKNLDDPIFAFEQFKKAASDLLKEIDANTESGLLSRKALTLASVLHQKFYSIANTQVMAVPAHDYCRVVNELIKLERG